MQLYVFSVGQAKSYLAYTCKQRMFAVRRFTYVGTKRDCPDKVFLTAHGRLDTYSVASTSVRRHFDVMCPLDRSLAS